MKPPRIVPAITIGKKELDEMLAIAQNVNVPVMDRNWNQIQQALVIESLIVFLKSYGIRVPFELGKSDVE